MNIISNIGLFPPLLHCKKRGCPFETAHLFFIFKILESYFQYYFPSNRVNLGTFLIVPGGEIQNSPFSSQPV